MSQNINLGNIGKNSPLLGSIEYNVPYEETDVPQGTSVPQGMSVPEGTSVPQGTNDYLQGTPQYDSSTRNDVIANPPQLDLIQLPGGPSISTLQPGINNTTPNYSAYDIDNESVGNLILNLIPNTAEDIWKTGEGLVSAGLEGIKGGWNYAFHGSTRNKINKELQHLDDINYGRPITQNIADYIAQQGNPEFAKFISKNKFLGNVIDSNPIVSGLIGINPGIGPVKYTNNIYGDIWDSIYAPFHRDRQSMINSANDLALGKSYTDQVIDDISRFGKGSIKRPFSAMLTHLPTTSGKIAGKVLEKGIPGAIKGGVGLAKSNKITRGFVTNIIQGNYTKRLQAENKLVKGMKGIEETHGRAALEKGLEQVEKGIKPANTQERVIKKQIQNLYSRYHKEIPKSLQKDLRKMATAELIAREKGITFQEAEKIVNNIEGKITKNPLKLEEYTQAISQDTEPYTKAIEKLIGKKVSRDLKTEILTKNNTNGKMISEGTLLKNSPETIEALENLVDDSMFRTLIDQNATIGNTINVASELVPGGKDSVLRILKKGGIDTIVYDDGTVTALKRAGGYRSGIRYLPENSKPIDAMHEAFHYAQDEIFQAAKTNSKLNKIAEDLFGKNWEKAQSFNNLDMANIESLTKKFESFIKGEKVDLKPTQRRLFEDIKKNFDNKYGKTEIPKDIDPEYLQLYNRAQEAIESGEMGVISHAGDKPYKLLEDSATFEPTDRVFAGKYSSRVWGQKSYEDIAKDLIRTGQWTEQNAQKFAEFDIGTELVNGTLGGESILPNTPKSTGYFRTDLATNGNLRKALDGIIDQRQFDSLSETTKAKYQAIDKNLAKELNSQLYEGTSGFEGAAGDLYRIGKSKMLSGGMYLAGNAWTAATSALLNNKLGIFDDAINAIKTGGQLARELGIARIDAKPRATTKIGQKVMDLNYFTGGAATQWLDRKIQNTFAEIGAHGRLRQEGISAGNRINFVQNSEDIRKIGEIANDVSKVANLNQRATIIPKKVINAMGMVGSPFFQWTDTALQNTLYTMKNSPFLTNLVVGRFMSDIGNDIELQERMKLGVETDRKGSIYRADPKTGKIKEIHIESIPMMNTLSTATTALEALQGKDISSSFNPNVVFLGEIINTMKGKNSFGKPLSNPNMESYMGSRYVVRDNGEIVKRDQGTPQELLMQSIKSAWGLPTLINTTLMPGYTAVTNEFRSAQDQRNYYRPYMSSLFGQIAPENTDIRGTENPLFGGNPTAPSSGNDLYYRLMGGYSNNYDPKFDIDPDAPIVNPRIIRGVRRSGTKRYYKQNESMGE